MTKIKFSLFCLVVCFTIGVAQVPTLYLKPQTIKSFNGDTKNATLHVIIQNEKNAGDAALTDAIKNHWKHGSVKYMSYLEFQEKLKQGSFSKSNIYLFPRFSGNYNGYLPGREGYYLTNDPQRLLSAMRQKDMPFYLHFSPYLLVDNKGNALKGYYDLMIKNFNYDVAYVRDEKNLKPDQKPFREQGLTFFKPKTEIKAKTLLLVKEQTQKQEKVSGKKAKKKKKNDEGKKADEKSFVVFPEDVEYAVNSSDKNIILSNGGNIYSAEDGSVFASDVQKPKNAGRLIILNSISLLATILFLVFVLNK